MFPTEGQSLLDRPNPRKQAGPRGLLRITKEWRAAPSASGGRRQETGSHTPSAPSPHSAGSAALGTGHRAGLGHRAWGCFGPTVHQLYLSFEERGSALPGHTVSSWHQEQNTWRGPTPRKGYISELGRQPALQIAASTAQALYTSSTLQAAVLELSQGCFLPGLGGRGGDTTVELQRVRGLSRSIMQKSSSPNLQGQQKEKADPFLGGSASDGTAKPTKRKQGKGPTLCLSFAGTPGPGRLRLVEQSLRAFLDGTLAQNLHPLFQFRIQTLLTGVCGWSQRPCNTVKN